MYVYIPHIYEAYKPLPSGGEGGGGQDKLLSIPIIYKPQVSKHKPTKSKH